MNPIGFMKLANPRSLRTRIHLLVASFLLTFVSGCIYVSDSGSGYSDADLTASTNRTLSREIPASLKTLEVENQFGAIHVIADVTQPARWSWNLTVRARSDDLARQRAEDTRCVVEQEGDRLRLTLALPAPDNSHRIRSDFEIRVPKSITVTTRNRFGETRIVGIAGDAEASAQNGPIELRDIAGSVRAETSFGSLIVRDTGPAYLKNRNGQIEASEIHGPLEAATSFGSLTARDIDGAVKARNQNGRLEAVRVKGEADLRTSFGELRAEGIDGNAILLDRNGRIEAARVKGNADARTSFAELRAEGIQGDAALANQNGSIRARDIAGSVRAETSFASLEVESAGPNLVCHNRNGSIAVRATSPALSSLEAETAFSPLAVRLPAGLKPAIQAHTSFGDIDSDFPVLLKSHGQDAFAELEPGTPRITLENRNGQIRITRDRSAGG